MCKNLGVHFDNNLQWTNHFQHVCIKISSNLRRFSQIKSYLSKQHRVLYYNAYIKPHFEHCCTIWGNSFDFNLYKVEKIQIRACKIYFGTDYATLEDALKTLNLLSFEEIIFINEAKLMYKIANDIVPIYLTELFQMRDGNNKFNLRSVSNKNFTIPKPKLSIFKRCLSCSHILVLFYGIAFQ